MQCVVFTSVPGTGKSTIAEAVGRQLGVPVFAKDWLDATLRGCSWGDTGVGAQPSGYVGYALLTTLAERQLRLAQSVILDSVASSYELRTAWRTSAHHYGARWQVIECICSDQALHRTRLAGRRRHIPGWAELTWAEVERVQAYYAQWNEPRLVLDAVDDLNGNIEQALVYLRDDVADLSV